MIIKVTFDRKWIYSGTGSNSFTVQRLISKCRACFGTDRVQVKETGMDYAVMDISGEVNSDELGVKVTTLINDQLLYSAPDKNIFTVEVDGEKKHTPEGGPGTGESGSAPAPTAPTAPAAPAGDEEKAEEPKKGPSPLEESIRRAQAALRGDAPKKEGPAPSAAEPGSGAPGSKKSMLEAIDERVGSGSFKVLCHEIHDRAPAIRQNHTQDVFFQDTYLFSINGGEGYTFAVEQLTGLIAEEEIRSPFTRVVEFELPTPENKELEPKMSNVIGSVSNALEQGWAISMNLSSWVGHTSMPIFKQLLLTVFRKNKSSLVVFRIPIVAQKSLDRTLEDLRDILSCRLVDFPPFNAEEQHELAGAMLNKYGYTVEAGAWAAFDRIIRKEHSDGFFYGIHTLRKTVNAMIRSMEMLADDNGKPDMLITADKIADIVPSDEAMKEVPSEKMLEELIGMEGVKRDIKFIINQILTARASKGKITSSMHMLFIGNPGTGKTTIARIIGQMLKEKGVLRIGNFYEYEGRDLCGQYVGETAVKTSNICREAYGSLLFIDEAYSLFRGDRGSRDYGMEAIDTLIAEMENHSDDLVVILAGYPEDMGVMLTANPGMKSRIPYTLQFDNYKGEELARIFMLNVNREFKYEEGFEERVKSYFTSLPEEMTSSKSFGNARYVRNIFERTWGKASLRCPGVLMQDLVLGVDDFNAAVAELDRSVPGKKRRSIGFGGDN